MALAGLAGSLTTASSATERESLSIDWRARQATDGLVTFDDSRTDLGGAQRSAAAETPLLQFEQPETTPIGPPTVHGAIDLALEWLATGQAADGSWDGTPFGDPIQRSTGNDTANVDYKVGATGLAVVALLSSGDTHQTGRYKNNIKNGLRYLRNRQTAEGQIGTAASHVDPLNHTLAALALTEAYGMTGSRLWKDSARRGANFAADLARAESIASTKSLPDARRATLMSWLWCVARSAQMSELDVKRPAARALACWADRVTEPKTGLARTRVVGSLSTDEPPRLPSIGATQRMTIAAALIRLDKSSRGHEMVPLQFAKRFIETRSSQQRVDGRGLDLRCRSLDLHYGFFGSRLMLGRNLFPKAFGAQGKIYGPRGSEWMRALRSSLLELQRRSPQRDDFGSWEPDESGTIEGNRVFATALACLTLGIHQVNHCRVVGRLPSAADQRGLSSR